MSNLAVVYSYQREYEKAEALLKTTLESRRRLLGDDHPSTLSSINNLAFLYYSLARYGEAESLYKEALDGNRRVLGDHHPSTARVLNNLAAVCRDDGRFNEAAAHYEQTIEDLTAAFGTGHPLRQSALRGHARCLVELERFVDAEPLCREAIAWAEDHAKNKWMLPNTRSLLGAALAGQGQLEEAEPLLLGGFDGLTQRIDEIPPRIRPAIMQAAVARVVAYYQRNDMPKEAEQWQNRITEYASE